VLIFTYYFIHNALTRKVLVLTRQHQIHPTHAPIWHWQTITSGSFVNALR